MKTDDTTQYRGCSIEILLEEYPLDPRDWDNLGTMACFHARYDLGDEHDYRSEHYSGWEELGAAIAKEQDACVILPLILLDHSGLSISVSRGYPYNCPWDAGQVGFIFVSKADVRKEYGRKRISKKLREKVERLLVGEVETYDMYLRGDVFGWVTYDPSGESLDSCWGYFGSPETSGLMEDARHSIDSYLKNAPMIEQFCS